MLTHVMRIINKTLPGGPLGFQIEVWDVSAGRYRIYGVLVHEHQAFAFAEAVSLDESSRVRVVDQRKRKMMPSEKEGSGWFYGLPDSAVVGVWANGQR